MNIIKIIVTIERGDDGTYSAHFSDDRMPFGLNGDGATVKEAIEDFYAANDDMREYYSEIGKEFPNIEYEFRYDMASFLQGYAYALTLAGLERISGVNQKQLGHYISGVRKPSEKTIHKIEQGIHAFGQEISKVKFI